MIACMKIASPFFAVLLTPGHYPPPSITRRIAGDCGFLIGQPGFAALERLTPDIVAADRQQVEGDQPDLGMVPPGMQSKWDTPVSSSQTASPSITKDRVRCRLAASTISGKRSDQPHPRRVNSRTCGPSRCTVRR
jgi:hypothetical protein